MLKRILFLLLLSFFGLISQAQILSPAKWTLSSSSESVKVGDEVELIFKATIDKNWYLYSSEFLCEDGPTKTTITFNPHPSYQLVGKLQPIKPIDKHDDIFECDVKIFKGTGEFRQKVKVVATNLKIEGNYDYQVCSDVDGKCIPNNEDFSFSKIKVTGKEGKAEAIPTIDNNQQAVIIPDADSAKEVKVAAEVTQFNGPTLDKSILDGEASYNKDSLWSILIIAFLAGLTALITPCVFPMIPMTVTFFLKDNQSKRQGIKNAIIFGFSIIALYTFAGTLFAVLLGTDGLNALATNWALNLFISVIFLVFALSFFGLFEITAPYKLVNKIDQQAEKGGLTGVFFMAFTLVLISFSCTVPIVGTVLTLSAGGEILKPVLMMFSYSFAFALPFTFFAFFPELIKSLPKSGGWLNSVKVTLGFIELALCLKFFSIADQAYHWGLLDRDINIALWIVIFGLLGLYLLGKIRFSSDSVTETLSVPRLMLAIGVFSFTLYLVPGLWGAPLKMLAGYLPPLSTHDFDLIALTRSQKTSEVCDEPKYADFLHLPHGLKGYYDYKQALACARQQNKPLFIDFTGHGCTNCREMEAVVWSDPQVLQRLQNDFVVVALYVDDKTELPEELWYTSKYDGKVKKTLGKQNADLQINNLDNNAQPFYVLVGKDERVLAWPYSYDRSVDKFVQFLESGKKKYKELY
ncbi:MAG: disulfide bond formation protein DsbD [Azospira oryzae]|nr:MAG: disulfide bond formation protein DsbD [Azospira oryzae]